ncbi:hypothetical protein ACHQM5_026041 [Ranunculus cassubicifolius]
MRLEVVLFFLSWLSVALAAAVNQTQTKPTCKPKCGNIEISYPFGVGANCSMSKLFTINCNTSFDPPKPFIGDLEVTQVSLNEVRIKNFVATSCYNDTGGLIGSVYSSITLEGSPYTFSSTKNKLTAIGCDAVILASLDSGNNSVACTSLCSKLEDTSDFSNFTSLTDIPIVLNYVVGNQTCKHAKQEPETFACKDNSYCYDAVDGNGYLCNCSEGYQGNPYLEQGCQDVNECEDQNNKPCKGICTNTQGSYNCSCPTDSFGDGTRNGTGCTKKNKKMPVLQLTLGNQSSL